MNENLPIKHIYELRLLNVDLQKDQEDRLLVTDVRIGPSGALEANQIFLNSEDTQKLFYNGQYFITEMPMEVYEDLKKDGHNHHHNHEDEDE
jgi:hypothetical protein